MNRIIEHQDLLNEVVPLYVEPYLKGSAKKWKIKAKKRLNKPVIWQFWDPVNHDDTPEIVKASLDSVRKFKPEDYDLVVLDLETISEYIELPDFLYDRINTPGFSFAFFTDLLRLCLLCSYGGIWIDATVYLLAPIDERLLSKEFFMFQRTECPDDDEYWEKRNPDYFSWDSDFKVNSLNSFIVAKKGFETAEVLKDILLNYWSDNCSSSSYFIFQIIFDCLINDYGLKNCQLESDVNPHLMARCLGHPYSEQLLREIISKSSIQKLTYVQNQVPGTMYEHLISEKNYQLAPTSGAENVTFCSMLFRIRSNKIDKIKQADRKFDDFYLKSLQKLTSSYSNIYLWCDGETADYLRKENVEGVYYKEMSFEDLPRHDKRDQYIEYLKEMKGDSFNEGYLLKDLEPVDVVDYLILVLSKIDIIKEAKDSNLYDTEYFCWIDAGYHNEVYTRFWANWDSVMQPTTKKAKFSLMTDWDQMTLTQLRLSSFEDIALIRAPFEIPASFMLFNVDIIDRFYFKYLESIKFLEKKGMISTEQSVFSIMLKTRGEDMFEFSKTHNYVDVVNLVAKSDNLDSLKKDYVNLFFRWCVFTFVYFVSSKRCTSGFKQRYLFKQKMLKLIRRRLKRCFSN